MMRLFLAVLLATQLGLASCSKTEQSTTAPEQIDIFKDYPIGLQKIAEGVWVHTSVYSFPGSGGVPSNGLVVEEEEGLILVDTAWGEMATGALLKKLKAETGKEVTKLVITNHQYDRLAGVDLLERQGVTVFTHPKTASSSAALFTPVPDTSVAALGTAGARNKIGPIEIANPGAGYTTDNLIVYVPASNILFAGGLVRGKDYSSIGNIANADIKAWPQSLNWVKRTYPEANLVVPSHGKGSKLDLVDDTLALIAKAVNSAANQADETPVKP